MVPFTPRKMAFTPSAFFEAIYDCGSGLAPRMRQPGTDCLF